MSVKTPTMETLYGITALVRKHHPETCFVVTLSNDDKIVFYKHTRLNDKLVGTEGILPFSTTLDKLLDYAPVSPFLQSKFFGVATLQQLRRGRYHATTHAIPTRHIVLSLTKDGGVHSLVDMNGRSDVTLFNIHLYITTNTVGYPTIHHADIHGYTRENEFVRERIQVT
jgi:hypothetical protein